jgi:anaerobic sulfite reductase subunit C
METKSGAANLKGRGILEQKEPGTYTVRLRITGGRVGAKELSALAKITADHGLENVHLTTRQGVEIPNVRSEDIDSICAAISAAGLGPAAIGPCVRTITACQGGICRHGIIDTQRLAQRVYDRFHGVSGLPHKFKIGITGCPNACIKPRENDLGIMGVMIKRFSEDLCTGCGLCVDACPSPGTLAVDGDTLIRNEDKCVGCGKCITACPTGAWESEGLRYVLFVGGKMGKRPRTGDLLELDVRTEDQVLDAVGATIEWYRSNGQTKERFGDTLDRAGVESLTVYVAAALEG